MLRKFKGQSTLEYAMIIAVVVGAIIAMQIYLRRGVQGKLRESVDNIGGQYSAGHMTSTVTVEQTGQVQSKETFGYADDGTAAYKQGVSQTKVIDDGAATVKRSAEGAGKETITKKLGEETLFP